MEDKSGKIILASSSPRRKEIMERAGYRFRVIPSSFEETGTDFFSFEFIESLAYQKALVVAKDYPDNVVVGADTLVVLDKKILGKPKDAAQAFEMLRELSGKAHMVVTAIAVISGTQVRKSSTTSYVTFENLTDEQIRYYVDTFKPLDKAGAYGIQEMPDGYIKSFEGSFENIMGMCPKALEAILHNIF
jgi:septum formation protein